MKENSFFDDFGTLTLDTLDCAAHAVELFRLKRELEELMCRHVQDCAKIIGQMEGILQQLEQVELVILEQTKCRMQQDQKTGG